MLNDGPRNKDTADTGSISKEDSLQCGQRSKSWVHSPNLSNRDNGAI